MLITHYVWGFVLLALATAQLPLDIEVTLSHVPLLSGDIDDCPTPRAESCNGGAAAHLAYARARRRLGKHVITMPTFDRSSIFAQMHPLSWGVNAVVFEILGFPNMFCPSSAFYEVRPGIERLQNTTLRAVVANAYVPPSNPWFTPPLSCSDYQHPYPYFWLPAGLALMGSLVPAMRSPPDPPI